MKFQVIGWTDFQDETYPEHDGESGAVDRAVVDALREGGYRFDGAAHQYQDSGTPVLSDGTRACYSMRAWGATMADALSVPNDDGMAYMDWYIDEEDLLREEPKFVLPPRGVDKTRIVPREMLCEEFEMHLAPAAFDAVSSGTKTVELRRWDEKRSLVCKDDLITFLCGERRCRVKVTEVRDFPSFDSLFDFRPSRYDTEEEIAERRAIVRAALFPGCDTPEKLLEFLNSVYSEKKHGWESVLAYRIERIER